MRRRDAWNCWIGRKSRRLDIEDDYDSEYRFDGMPDRSLQGLDRNARVIYIGHVQQDHVPSAASGIHHHCRQT